MLNTEEFIAYHVATCAGCSTSGTQCPVLRALAYLLILRHDPRHWRSDVPHVSTRRMTKTQRISPDKEHPLPGEHAAFIASKHGEWTERGILEAVDPEATRPRTELSPGSTPVFIATKYKAPDPSASAEYARWVSSLSHSQLVDWVMGRPPPVPRLPESVQVKLRPIYDLRATNQLRPLAMPFRFKSVHDACRQVRRDSLLGAVDFSEGFTSVPVAASAGEVLKSQALGGKIWRHRRLPFGYWAAPFIFCILSGEAARQAASLCLSVADYVQVYIDDTLLILSDSAEDAQRSPQQRFDACVSHFQRVGFGIQPAKLQQPKHTVEYLGCLLSATDQGVEATVPRHKAAAIERMLCLALATPHRRLPRRFWEKLLGKLQAAAFMLPGSAPFLGTMRQIQRGRQWFLSGPRTLLEPPGDTLAALTALRTLLHDTAGGELISTWNPAIIVGTAIVHTDASGAGGLGGVFHATPLYGGPVHTDAVSKATPGKENRGNGRSTLLEAEALCETLRALGRSLPPRHNPADAWSVSCYTDNKALTHIWDKGYSTKDVRINDCMQCLSKLCRKHRLLVQLQWVPREQNQLADFLSHPAGNPVSAIQPFLNQLALLNSEQAKAELLQWSPYNMNRQ